MTAGPALLVSNRPWNGHKGVHTGQWAIFGLTPLTSEAGALVPGKALDGFSAIAGSDGRFLPLAGLEFRADPNEAEARLWPGLHFDDRRP